MQLTTSSPIWEMYLTGQSLLRKHNNSCPQCLNELKREKRAQRQQGGAYPTFQRKEPING